MSAYGTKRTWRSCGPLCTFQLFRGGDAMIAQSFGLRCSRLVLICPRTSAMAHATSTIKTASAINSLATIFPPPHPIATLWQRARNLRLFLGVTPLTFCNRARVGIGDVENQSSSQTRCLQAHTEFMQKQMSTFTEQAKSLGEAYTKAATDATKPFRMSA